MLKEKGGYTYNAAVEKGIGPHRQERRLRHQDEDSFTRGRVQIFRGGVQPAWTIVDSKHCLSPRSPGIILHPGCADSEQKAGWEGVEGFAKWIHGLCTHIRVHEPRCLPCPVTQTPQQKATRDFIHWPYSNAQTVKSNVLKTACADRLRTAKINADGSPKQKCAALN